MKAILPFYLTHLADLTRQEDNHATTREEVTALGQVATSIRALINSTEILTRYYLTLFG